MTLSSSPIQRQRLMIQGNVQGVGFRPFVYRLATSLGLTGDVRNVLQGVQIEIEGRASAVQQFVTRLATDHPPNAMMISIEQDNIALRGDTGFSIHNSHLEGAAGTFIAPDLATCTDCLNELFDTSDRRHLYPFINCTNCGPRYSIALALPYDRNNTTMHGFTMCAACLQEYNDPANRRFHAQPNACARCGPQLALWDAAGQVQAQQQQALWGALAAIRAGQIVALKGLGGFQLMVNAHDKSAVRRLRKRKLRPHKPFALMYPNLKALRQVCQVSDAEAQLLSSPAAPIVLLKRHAWPIDCSIAPDNPYLGVMLPYTPLHHLLLQELELPLIATSGNLSAEPICTDEVEALERLGSIADVFLVHDRPIARHVDDSIVRVLLGRSQLLRRARGYAPLPIVCPSLLPARINRQPSPRPGRGLPTARSTVVESKENAIVALGGHLKNSIALALGNTVIQSQHIGDLDTMQAYHAFQQTLHDLPHLHAQTPTLAVTDMHPDYRSTRAAATLNIPVMRVQHHEAHALSCMAEHGLQGPLLAVVWDGTGYGQDGTIWGGEFLHITPESVHRTAFFKPFLLPGGEQAARQPRRAALGCLYGLYGDVAFEKTHLPPFDGLSLQERRIIHTMLARRLNCPRTSSVGRLFDACASILGLFQEITFEGQAASGLEYAIQNAVTDDAYPFEIRTKTTAQQPSSVIDWRLLLQGIVADRSKRVDAGYIAAKIHNTFIRMIVDIAQQIGETCIVLSGGCFQNRYLTERTIQRLQQADFQTYWQQQAPPNDGGIALGQIYSAWRRVGKGQDVSSRTGEN